MRAANSKAITFLLATRNAHKVEEIRTILGSSISCLTLNDFPEAPTVKEDANSFAGNATLKAVALAEWLSRTGAAAMRSIENFFVLADDSGLEVDALQGAPGVHSARFAAVDSGREGNSTDGENNAKLLRLLQDVPREKRSARFRCVIALTPLPGSGATGASPVCESREAELQTELFEGTCEGWIAAGPSGAGGFGYDPLFVPEGFDRSFAELGEDAKNGLSHRAKALAALRRHLEAV
ncbi:MAG TPA: non-canonical purine NTP pyrophosphatase [Verrucomicrobiae bacterium]|nr:non-canonical purine NTP pyrophosphatase [Verrucomicrobiae bacterium]